MENDLDFLEAQTKQRPPQKDLAVLLRKPVEEVDAIYVAERERIVQANEKYGPDLARAKKINAEIRDYEIRRWLLEYEELREVPRQIDEGRAWRDGLTQEEILRHWPYPQSTSQLEVIRRWFERELGERCYRSGTARRIETLHSLVMSKLEQIRNSPQRPAMRTLYPSDERPIERDDEAGGVIVRGNLEHHRRD